MWFADGFGKLAKRERNRRHNRNDSIGNGTTYDPVAAGIAFGRKEMDRIERELKDIPGVARAYDLGGSGLGLGDYGQTVLDAADPIAALKPEDRAVYGPPE